MNAPFTNCPAPGSQRPAQPDEAAAPNGRDFITPDGRLVPRALGEAGLRQRTAILVGGMLVGQWPEQL